LVANREPNLVGAGDGNPNAQRVRQTVAQRLLGRILRQAHGEPRAEVSDLGAVAVEHHAEDVGRCGLLASLIPPEHQRPRIDVQERTDEQALLGGVARKRRGAELDVRLRER
jgi:hypothetical protein